MELTLPTGRSFSVKNGSRKSAASGKHADAGLDMMSQQMVLSGLSFSHVVGMLQSGMFIPRVSKDRYNRAREAIEPHIFNHLEKVLCRNRAKIRDQLKAFHEETGKGSNLAICTDGAY